MCGLYGAFLRDDPLQAAERAWARSAESLLRHRGPDGARSLERLDGRCLLGHLRLSIIDLQGGAQPLANEDGSVWTVCNGEIYNFVELRARLETGGHRFTTRSDSETLVHLYEDEGEKLLEELDGMFALAILDEKRRGLLLARDRFGEKPLYWAELPGRRGLIFASELKALAAHPGIGTSLDARALAQYLALRCIPAPRTHREGIRKLRPGEALWVAQGSPPRLWRYWEPRRPRRAGTGRAMPVAEAVAEVRERVRDSVRLRLRSDVPVGAFLSGGIDSTMIAAAARELEPGSELSTFCASFENDQLDESRFARQVAERIGSDHTEVRFSASELLPIFHELIDHYDEPFADASMFPTFAVCRAARARCKVMLSGDGGDELFAGYREHYAYFRWRGLRRLPGIRALARPAARMRGENRSGKGVLEFLARDNEELLFPERDAAFALDCLRPEFRAAGAEGLAELREAASRHLDLPHPESLIEATACGYLPEQVLVKVDRASMRVALESRAPLLNPALLDFVWGLPVGLHFERGLGKALLRRALPDWVPDEIRWRDKRGFTPPLADWLRGPLLAELRGSWEEPPAALAELVDPAPARTLLSEHLAGADRSDRLFRWLVLARRCREAAEAPAGREA